MIAPPLGNLARVALLAIAAHVTTIAYPGSMVRALSRSALPVLLPARLPASLRAAAPAIEYAGSRGYTVVWSFDRRCDDPSCVEFSVTGGADAIAPPGSRSVASGALRAAYHAFACPLHCQPETLTLERGRHAYQLASKTPLGVAGLFAIARSLATVRD